MGEEDWLGTLGVGVARHWNVNIPAGLTDEDVYERSDSRSDAEERSFCPHAGVGGDLVVATATGMQATLGRSDQLAQAAFDSSVDVFVGDRKSERAGFDIVPDLPEPFLDTTGVLCRNDRLATEHPHMGNGAADVLTDHAIVEHDGRGETLGTLVRPFGKSSSPESRRSLRSFTLHPCFHLAFGQSSRLASVQPAENRFAAVWPVDRQSHVVDDSTGSAQVQFMATLVTGGNGWVPSHVVRRLAQRGEKVVSYDLMQPDDLLLEMLDGVGEVVFEHGDVVSEPEMLDVARRHGVTSIVHAAAITPRLQREMSEPRRVIEVNLLGTVTALDVARQLEGFKRFVYVSSCAAWGPHPEAQELTEDLPSHATGLYGVTKYTSERVCRRYAELFGLDVVSVRLANVFGPMERDTPGYQGGTEPREMLRLHYAGEAVRVNSLEGPWLDWTYVEDIAEGIELAWSTPRMNHDVYSITCGQLYSIGDILEAFARYVPGFRCELVRESEANYLVAGGPPGPIPSNARFCTATGWEPRTTFDEGMRLYLAWIEKQGPQ